MDDLKSFARLVDAIRPWRGRLVLIGGWAHRLYRLHPLAKAPAYEPIVTRDTDLALNVDTPLEGDIRTALEKAGFKEQLAGESSPPITYYELGDGDAGFYAEFLTPLRGSGIRRDGKPDATIAVAGVTAQKLRHLDILLSNPWVITIESGGSIPVETPLDVQVPNPVRFIAQKLLIHGDRPARKQAQDVLYIHDTLELFAENLTTLSEGWANEVVRELPGKTAKKVVAMLEIFAGVTDNIRGAATMATGRSLEPERMQQFCKAALGEIFGKVA